MGAASEEQNARTDHRAGKVMAQEIAHTFGLWCHTFDACYNCPHATTGHIDGSDVGFNLSGDLGRSDVHLVSLDGERDYFDGMTLGGRTGDFMSYTARHFGSPRTPTSTDSRPLEGRCRLTYVGRPM